MSHLRLQAAYCVLKIARVVEYKDLFKPEIYQELAMLINVSYTRDCCRRESRAKPTICNINCLNYSSSSDVDWSNANLHYQLTSFSFFYGYASMHFIALA